MSVLLTVVVMGVVGWGAVVQGAPCPGGGLADCPTQQSNTSGGGKTSRDYCYTARIRSTVLQGLPFGGVPTVLALDFMCFLVLLFVFSILRKVAWDYGRLALVTDADRQNQRYSRLDEQKHVASAMTSELPDRYERLTSVPAQVDFEQRDTAYENAVFLEARICYDVAKLMSLNSERKKTERSMKFFKDLQSKEHIPSMINPKPCGHLCCCIIKGCEQEEAVSYYTKLESKLKEEYRKEREKVNSKPLGMAFVTFQNEAMTAIILKDYNACNCQGCHCQREPRSSSFSQHLHTYSWTVGYAPDPQNVYWEHLSVGGFPWWLRCFIINCILFLLLFFLTTPAIIISTMDKFNVTKPVEYLNNPIVTQFFPTLLLWAFSALLPTIVYYSAFFEAHWTRSGENRTTMHKCYTFLIFMVLLLPSLGLSSLDVFFRWLFDKRFLADAAVRFECVFLPDNGAFFVNYVIASAFIGNAMDLLRIPGLLMYMTRLCLARSAAERRNVKRHQAYEFQFGAAYAWMMCVFTVVMTYSITCPIIVPFGELSSTVTNWFSEVMYCPGLSSPS
ncbi:LOW QUALITY PROTEIN: CSC1-like protein 2, partial [Salvelinus sp. IW2-2015]|uniref:LOW QUALITY PROTEIN: CSC1-like protein 2 n=1 Tax=Salvelinus sp. IW2-2015 TaxID=2691554 RepID=UPI0038D42E58